MDMEGAEYNQFMSGPKLLFRHSAFYIIIEYLDFNYKNRKNSPSFIIAAFAMKLVR